MNKYWFVPKTFGRGFVPITREGWVATLVLVGILYLDLRSLNFFTSTGPTTHETARFLVDLFLIIFSTSRFFEKHCDGELKRRQGNK